MRTREIVVGEIRDPDLRRTACADVLTRSAYGIALDAALGAMLPPELKSWPALWYVLLGEPLVQSYLLG